MPLYEYQCDGCGRKFELIRKFSDPPLEACPTCGGTVQKLMSSPAFQFKGSGWYITDYARKDQAPSSPADGSTAEAKSETGKGDKDGAKGEKGEKGEQADAAKTAAAGRGDKDGARPAAAPPASAPSSSTASTGPAKAPSS